MSVKTQERFFTFANPWPVKKASSIFKSDGQKKPNQLKCIFWAFLDCI